MVLFEEEGETEVYDFGFQGEGVDHDVMGFDVSVDDFEGVQVEETGSYLFEDALLVGGGERVVLFEEIHKIFSLDVLQNKIVVCRVLIELHHFT